MNRIRFATNSDLEYLKSVDKHIDGKVLECKLNNNEIIIIENDSEKIGWLRFNKFWDEIPFMNLLMIHENYRNQGLGKKVVEFWESEMRKRGHDTVMTSTLSDEGAQHFYRKQNYKDSGSLLLEGEALEIIFTKKI